MSYKLKGIIVGRKGKLIYITKMVNHYLQTEEWLTKEYLFNYINNEIFRRGYSL